MTNNSRKLFYFWLVGYSGLLSSIGAFSIDTNLPVLGEISSDFSSTQAIASLTITVFIWSIGIGQGFWGFFSDRFGRKPTIFWGLLIFIAGSILAIYSSMIESLIIARATQGFGAAIGPVISRAILRDCFTGRELSKAIAISVMVFSLGPIFAPLIGAIIADFYNWRAIFSVLLISSLLLALATFFLKETIAVRHDDALSHTYILYVVKRLFLDSQSRFYTILCTLIWSGFISILSQIPRFYENLFEIKGMEFAKLFFFIGLGIVFGQLLNRKLISSIGGEKTALLALATMAISSSITIVFALFGAMSYMVLTLFTISFSFAYPIFLVISTAKTLDPHGDIAGGISSVFGFFYQTFAATIASIIAVLALSLELWLLSILITSGLCLISMSVKVLLTPQIRQNNQQ